jgi:hypothetical protein
MIAKTKTRGFNIFLVALSWTALLLELFIIVKADVSNHLTVFNGLDRYFSYFTITTNLFVAMVFTAQLYKNGNSKFWNFFTRYNVISCATGAIIVVCIVYHFLLSGTHNIIATFDLIVDRILHYILPPLTIVFWWLVVPKNKINFLGVLAWLTYPLVYLIYILIRGAIMHSYPYDFINVDKNGMAATLQFAASLFAFYIFLGCILVSINRFVKRIN